MIDLYGAIDLYVCVSLNDDETRYKFASRYRIGTQNIYASQR